MGKVGRNSKFLLAGSASILAVLVLFFASVSTDDVSTQSISDNYEKLCGYPVTDEMRLDIISKAVLAGSEPVPYLEANPGNFTHVKKLNYLTDIPILQYWFELEDNQLGYFELGACDLDDSNIIFVITNKILSKPPIPDFDTAKYVVSDGSASMLLYKDTFKPVLDIDNCQRGADRYTELGIWKLQPPPPESHSDYTAWKNQGLPLMDYCASVGDYVLKTADGNINWSFVLK